MTLSVIKVELKATILLTTLHHLDPNKNKDLPFWIQLVFHHTFERVGLLFENNDKIIPQLKKKKTLPWVKICHEGLNVLRISL